MSQKNESKNSSPTETVEPETIEAAVLKILAADFSVETEYHQLFELHVQLDAMLEKLMRQSGLLYDTLEDTIQTLESIRGHKQSDGISEIWEQERICEKNIKAIHNQRVVLKKIQGEIQQFLLNDTQELVISRIDEGSTLLQKAGRAVLQALQLHTPIRHRHPRNKS